MFINFCYTNEYDLSSYIKKMAHVYNLDVCLRSINIKKNE